MDTLLELHSFRKLLLQYQRFIKDNRFSLSPVHPDTKVDNLRNDLLLSYSRLENGITRYGGRSMVTVDLLSDKKKNVFQYALEAISMLDCGYKLDAIDKSISIVNKAMVKLEKEAKSWPVNVQNTNHKYKSSKPKAFISYGKGEGALLKLERFLIELGVQSIIVKDQPNLDRTVDKKVEDCLDEADFVIILATGDDKVGNKLQPRQNVIHEIGLAQKTHPGKIIYLLEEGTELPSNIRPKVYETFARQSMDRAFTAIIREIKKLGFL